MASDAPIKTIGLHTVTIALHPEVEANVTVNVARSEDEAKRQARGEDLTMPQVEGEEPEGEGETAEAEPAASQPATS